MSPSTASSNSSADLSAGTVVAGFRLGRVLGRGPQATVYEATQLSLGRRVAFKLLHDDALTDRVRRLAWPEHPGAVSLYGSGTSEHGPWLAMQLIDGQTLAETWAPLDDVAGALARAHAAGIVHGDVRAGNILIHDGRARLTDFGLADGTIEADRAALAALRRDHPRPPERRRRAAVGAGAAALAVAGFAGMLVAGGSSGEKDEPRAAPAPGVLVVGSELPVGGIEGVDCNGRPPSGTSPACTVMQRTIHGRDVEVAEAGTITAWAVRGSKGRLALQVLRPRGRNVAAVGRSAEVTIPNEGLHVFPTDLRVAAGDRIALEVPPDATIGIRRDTAAATTERWVGPLLDPPRPPERATGTGFDVELALQVTVRPGSAEAPLTSVQGAAAARAPGGQTLATHEVDVGGDQTRTVAVVTLGGRVAVDLFDGERRLARASVPGADGHGNLVRATPHSGALQVRWRNPDGREVRRQVRVGAAQLS